MVGSAHVHKAVHKTNPTTMPRHALSGHTGKLTLNAKSVFRTSPQIELCISYFTRNRIANVGDSARARNTKFKIRRAIEVAKSKYVFRISIGAPGRREFRISDFNQR